MSLADPPSRKPVRRSSRKAAARPKRQDTINIRVTRELHLLIDRAAAAEGKTRSEFMLESARARAQDVLLDRTLFLLDERRYADFVRVLDNPPPPNRALKKLMRSKSPWEA